MYQKLRDECEWERLEESDSLRLWRLAACLFFVLPFPYSSIYSPPGRPLVTANSVAVPDSATESGKHKSDSQLPSGTSSGGRPRCVFANTILDFRSWRASVGLQLAFVFLNICMARCPCHQRNIPWACWFQIQNIWHMCALLRCKHILARKRFIFPQCCWTDASSAVWCGRTVIGQLSRNPTRFMPKWIISFWAPCRFLEMNNRPFHHGSLIPPVRSWYFSRCFRPGLLLQKSTTQVKPGQSTCPGGGGGMFSPPNSWVMCCLRVRKGKKHTLKSEQALAFKDLARKLPRPASSRRHCLALF